MCVSKFVRTYANDSRLYELFQRIVLYLQLIVKRVIMPMLHLFKNPEENPEELENYRQWLPEGFDPHRFDLHATQLRIVDYLRVVRNFTER